MKSKHTNRQTIQQTNKQTTKKKKQNITKLVVKMRTNVSQKGILSKKNEKLEPGPTVSDGLPTDAHSRVRSHYCSTRGLLPAGFPPWAGSSLLRQPGNPKLLQDHHIDAELSADTRSTWHAREQNPRPQAVLRLKPPSSWITGARHNSRREK